MKSDDMRLNLAIQKEKEEKEKTAPASSKPATVATRAQVDLADLYFGPSLPPPAPLGPPPGQPAPPALLGDTGWKTGKVS